MRRNLGLLGLAGVLAACASFTAADPAPVPPGGDAADAGQDDAFASADGSPGSGSSFCQDDAGQLCVDFESGLGGAGWPGAASVSPTPTAGTVMPVPAPLRDETKALRAQLKVSTSPAGATVQLDTATLDGAAHVELDVYVVDPGARTGGAITLVSLSRDQPQGFLVEANLVGAELGKATLFVYGETRGGTQNGGASKQTQAFEIQYGRWYRIHLGADLLGTGNGSVRLDRVESPPISVRFDMVRVKAPLESTVETGIGLWRETGTGNETLEAYFDNVVAGPGL